MTGGTSDHATHQFLRSLRQHVLSPLSTSMSVLARERTELVAEIEAFEAFADRLAEIEPVATVSATVLPIAGGIGRLVIGNLSDRVDREKAMAVSFILLGIGLALVVTFATAGMDLAFVAAVFVATFFWSPQYTLFPSIMGDYYGEHNSSANYAFLYSGKIWGGVFGGVVTSWLVTVLSWSTTFYLSAVIAALAGVVSLFLQPPAADTETGDAR